jgi:CelD/BcsL family acetyltransferase involved in cellulose biosynthesis
VSDIEVFSSLEEAEPHWRALEQKATATPFQRFAWMASYARAISAASGAKPAIVMVRDADARPAAIMPLELVRRGGFPMLRSMGGKHASFHLPLATPQGAAIIADDPARLLARAGKIVGGASLALLTHQPIELDDAPNPFARAGQVATIGHAYETVLASQVEAFIRQKFSGEARKKLRKKRQALERIGPVVASRPIELAEIEATLSAFLAQKERRFRARGVPNPFAEASTQAFLRAVTKPSGAEVPAIELHALKCGNRIIAVFGLATGFSRASGTFTSFDDDPAIARCSPGDILLHDMVRDLIGRGFRRFDLGAGEARYKNAFCDREVALASSVTPFTALGHAASPVLRAAWRAKSTIKRSTRLMRIADRLRLALRAAS